MELYYVRGQGGRWRASAGDIATYAAIRISIGGVRARRHSGLVFAKLRFRETKIPFWKTGVVDGALVGGGESIFRRGVDELLAVGFYLLFWFTRLYWWGSGAELYYVRGQGSMAR